MVAYSPVPFAPYTMKLFEEQATMFLKPETRATLEPLFTLTNAHGWDNADAGDKWWFIHDLIEETGLTGNDALVEYVGRAFENMLDVAFEDAQK